MAGAFALAAVLVGGPSRAASSSPLTVTKTPSSSQIASGGQLTYTIVVTNTGGAAVSNVVMTDQVNGIGVVQTPPALPQFTITSTKGSCTQGGSNGNLITCNAGSMAGGESWAVTIGGQVTAPAGTTLFNTASVTATKSSTTFTTPSNSTSVLVTPAAGGNLPDLTINKTGPTSAVVGAPMTYTLTVNNIGAGNASNVKVVDTLPAGVGFVSTSTTSLFTCSPAGSPVTVTCTGGAVNAGQNGTIAINTTAPSTPGTITNTAVVDPDNTIAESNELNNTSAQVNTNVTSTPPPTPLLSIQKTDGNPAPSGTWWTGAGPDPVNPGQQLTYKILVTNNATGNNSTANYVSVTDGTQGLDASSITASQTVVNGQLAKTDGCTVSAPQVKCTVKALASGGTITITIVGTVTQSAGSTIFNTATVNGNIQNTGVTDTASASTTVRPAVDLSITNSDSPDPVCARSWPTSSPNQHLASGPDGLVPGASGAPTKLLNDPAPAPCLGGLTYSLVVGNSGNGGPGGAPATNVEVRDPLPPGLIFDSYQDVDGAGFVCKLLDSAGNVAATAAVGTVVDCTGGTIPPASTRRLNLLFVAPPTAGTITNTVTVDPNNAIFESDETNNTATTTTTVGTGVDLTIWKGDAKGDNPPGDGAPNLTDGFDPIATNGNGTYTIIVDNVGPQDATGIKVVDTMPAGTRFRSASGDSGFTCSQDGSTTGGIVTCVGGHLIGTESEFYSPAGSSSLLPGDQFATIKIRFFAPSTPQTMHNEVRVNPDNTIPEIDQLNNVATDDSVVTSCLNQSDCTNTGAFNELTIDKTQVSPANPVARNGIVTYNLKVSNLGSDPVSGVVVTDRLPAGFRFIDASDTLGIGDPNAFTCAGPDGNGVVTCSGGSLSGTLTPIPGGAPTTRNIVIHVFAPDTPGSYTNLAFVDPNNTIPEGNEFNNQSSVTTVVTNGGNGPYIDLAIKKTAPATVIPGGEIDYNLHVSNAGAGDAFNVMVEDVLPANVTFISAADNNPSAGMFICSNSMGVVTCTGGTVTAGGSRDITIKVNAPTNIEQFAADKSNISLDITNQAFVDPNNAIPEGDETNNASSATTTVKSAIDLTIKKDGPDSTTQNSEADYTITVTNNCTGSDSDCLAQNVAVHDPLPVGLIVLDVTTSDPKFACQVQQNPVNVVDCLGTLTKTDNQVVITIHFFMTLASGSFTNVACVDPADVIAETNELNNCSTKVTTVAVPDLAIKKTAVTDPVTIGGSEEYDLHVSNIGTADASGVTVHDSLDSGLDYVNATGTNGFTCSFSAPDVTCTGDLAAGQATDIQIQTKVNSSATNPISNTATVDPASGETNTSNNSDSVTVSLGGPAIDLVANTALDTPDPVNVGQVLTYTSNVINNGTATANGVTIEQSVPSGVSFVSTSATNGFLCSFGGTNVDCTGDLGAGADTTITIKGIVTASPPATLTSTLTVDPSNAIAESNELNNTQTATTTVTGSTCSSCTDLAISDIVSNPADPATIAADGATPLTYTFSVANVGDTKATGGVSISDTLDANTTLVSATATNGFSCTGTTTITCDNSGADLAAGQGTVVTIVVTVNSGTASGTSITDSASVDAVLGEFSTANNGPVTSTIKVT